MIGRLKRLPITYKGELHHVRLVNFSIPIAALEGAVPSPLEVLEVWPGRALISMVDVQLEKMQPVGFLENINFSYRHIGFRLLIDDRRFNPDSQSHGIYFLRSFTDKLLLAIGGSLFTHYGLRWASIKGGESSLALSHKAYSLYYEIDSNRRPPGANAVKQLVGRIDRAYAVSGNAVYKTQIQREKWPLEEIEVDSFSTNFFPDARFEAAFRVPEVIPYVWEAPVPVKPLGAIANHS